MIRIVIADDHTLFRQGLTELLGGREDLNVVGVASEGTQVLSMVRELAPDVLILDISMPGIDGFEVARGVREAALPVKIIILTMHKDSVSVRKAFDGGLDGYVLKEEAFHDLVYAITAVTEGKRFFSPAVMTFLSKRSPEEKGEILSQRECDVVTLIAGGKTTKEIAKELGISTKTVDTHRQRIMEKLGAHKTAEIVLYAVRRGLVS